MTSLREDPPSCWPLLWQTFIFWRNTSGYFANGEEMPLLHAWSLAVEEQFYLVMPLFLVMAFYLFAPRSPAPSRCDRGDVWQPGLIERLVLALRPDGTIIPSVRLLRRSFLERRLSARSLNPDPPHIGKPAPFHSRKAPRLEHILSSPYTANNAIHAVRLSTRQPTTLS
jgi:hypothetical protein